MQHIEALDSNRVFQKVEETVCRSPGDSVYYQSRIHLWKNSRCFLTDTYLFAATVVTLLLFVLQNHHVLGGGGGGGLPVNPWLAKSNSLGYGGIIIATEDCSMFATVKQELW